MAVDIVGASHRKIIESTEESCDFTISQDSVFLGCELSGIRRAPIDASKEAEAFGEGMVALIETDDISLFWFDNSFEEITYLYSISLQSGHEIGLAVESGQNPIAMEIGTNNVFWLLADDPNCTGSACGRLFRSPLSPGDSSILACNQNYPVDIAVNKTAIYWINRGSWDEPNAGSVYMTPLPE